MLLSLWFVVVVVCWCDGMWVGVSVGWFGGRLVDRLVCWLVGGVCFVVSVLGCC